LQTPRSFTRIYWLAWLGVFCCFAAALMHYGIENTLGSFALFSVLLGGFAFNFEFGRLMGFLKLHAPSFYSQLPSSRWFEFSAFFSPRLLRTPEIDAPHYYAMQTYRAAWRFSVVAIFLPLLINWVAKAYAL
jgi:hypothetical protein